MISWNLEPWLAADKNSSMLDEDDFWNNTLALAFEKQPGLATAMAHHLAQLRDKLKGENGVKEAVQILKCGITELWPYTDFNHACIKLYHRFLSKDGLLPQHDPLMIVPDLEKAEREHKARPKRKRIVRATRKRKPTLKLVKGKRVA